MAAPKESATKALGELVKVEIDEKKELAVRRTSYEQIVEELRGIQVEDEEDYVEKAEDDATDENAEEGEDEDTEPESFEGGERGTVGAEADSSSGPSDGSEEGEGGSEGADSVADDEAPMSTGLTFDV